MFIWFVSATTAFAQTVPVISYQPSPVTVFAGQSASFYANANGSSILTYQWQRSPAGSSTWTNLSDAGTYSGTGTGDLSLALVTLAMHGDQFRCVATNSAGSATSVPALLTVNPAVAPQIFGLSSGVTINSGDYIILNPSISGSLPMTFQWKKDGTNVSGATTSSYSAKATTADNGQYVLTATNYAGTATGITVSVTVNPPVAPGIFNLPAIVTVDYGSLLSLEPSISGTQPMTFQWKKDGVTIANATRSFFNVSSATTANSGVYTLEAANSVGTTVSSAATVTVNAAIAPVIFNLPATLTLNSGDTLYLSASITGTPPMTYQWKKDGVAIPNANSFFYAKYGGVTADGGQYTLTATNAVGSVTSAAVTVTVNPAVAPVIYNVPSSISADYGQSFTISVSVLGTSPITYQWKKDGAALSKGTYSNNYYNSNSGITTADSGQYTLTATNSAGTTTSSAVAVTVNPAVAPGIFNLPSTVTVAYGENFSLNPTVIGTQPITYQWKKDGVAIAGATSSGYSKTATSADSGVYTLTATNLAGTVTSSTVTVIVSPAVAPAIFNLPSTLTVDYGDSLYLSPTVTGTQPITYQWKKDGVMVAGANSISYFKNSNVTTADNGQYTLTATNTAGTITSSAVTVTVNAAVAPAIFNLPAAVSADYGNSLNLSPTVTGTLPITYQWKKGGVAIAGATNAAFSKTVTTADNGVYTLVATNLAGTATSSSVAITVNPAVAPGIFNLPVTVTLNYGDPMAFVPSVTGTQPITYQWKKDGVAIADATFVSFSNYYMTAADSGQYTLEATNLVGTTVSSTIAVTVAAAIAPTFTLQPVSLSMTPGLTANFSASATGTSSITYQWKVDGQQIDGATNSTLVIPNVQAGNAGSYTVVATNPGGTITSNAATLSINSFGVVAASAGITHSLFVKSDGTMWAVGYNGNGQLGDGTTTARLNPTQISSNVVSVAAGPYHSMFLKADGTLWGMGSNEYGQLGDGSTIERHSPVQIATSVVSVTVGLYHSLYLKSDGTLWGMGNDDYQQLDDGTHTLSRTNSTPKLIATGVRSMSAGALHTLFVKLDGTLWAMGYNYYGQLGGTYYGTRPSPEQIASSVSSVSAGSSHSLFVKADGTLWAMGKNGNGQLGDGTFVDQHSPEQITTGVSSVSAGAGHSLFVKTDGTLWGMGDNFYGDLGDGTTTVQRIPEQIATGVQLAISGNSFSFYIKTDGSLWAMGANGNGQLGDGTTNYQQITPEQILAGTVSAPSAPSVVTATDGAPDPGVRLTWRPTLGTTAYEVWRSTTNDSSSATRIATNVPIPLYYDLTATAGTIYFYWIKAVNNTGASGFSNSGTNILPPSNAVITFTVE